MLKYLPWKYVVSRVARAQGLVDPVKLMSRLEAFAQPMELKEPLELLRAGMVFHARGILNTGVIQHNLDWVWPHWVERQYDPEDDAFIPRAFSLTHINLTHRNWTAVGIPDCDHLPLVDPRGLVTPFWDSWSLDTWVLADDGRELLPSRLDEVEQTLDLHAGPTVVTRAALGALRLAARTWVETDDGIPTLELHATAHCDVGGWLAIAVRPYNPEGVSFVHEIEVRDGGRDLELDDGRRIHLADRPDRQILSHYRRGDALREPRDHADNPGHVHCPVGMATAAALYRLAPDNGRQVRVSVPLTSPPKIARTPTIHSLGTHQTRGRKASPRDWDSVLHGRARLKVPEPKIQFLYDAALQTLVLHSPKDVYPGPFTYKRFWFRDAAFILHGLLTAGFTHRVSRVLDLFPGRQTRRGHFLSQEAEWDSNGEALWIMERFCALTGQDPSRHGGKRCARERAGLSTSACRTSPRHPTPGCCRPASAPSISAPTTITIGTISGPLPASRPQPGCSRALVTFAKPPGAATRLGCCSRPSIAASRGPPNPSAAPRCRHPPTAASTREPSARWPPAIHCSCSAATTPA